MRDTIIIATRHREQLIDITREVGSVVAKSGIGNGLVSVYAQGATCAIMIQENWDESVQTDVVNLLRKLIPRGVWFHDEQDGNGDAHLKAGLVGPSETIPVIDGRLGLSRWQNIFLCEFDGPRQERKIVCTVIADRWGFVRKTAQWQSSATKPIGGCLPQILCFGQVYLQQSAFLQPLATIGIPILNGSARFNLRGKAGDILPTLLEAL